MVSATGWRPRAITIGALKLFVANNLTKPKGLERAHEFHRRDIIKILIEKIGKEMSRGNGFMTEVL